MFPVLMSDKLEKQYGIKRGIELIRAHGGRDKIQLVTNNYRSLEGKRSTFVVLNETHHWVKGNGGIKMYETIDGNTTKMDGRYLSITNAYLPGEESVAEAQRRDYEEIRTGQAEDIGFLYDSIEAHPDTPMTKESLEIVIPKIRGDAVWLKVETILRSAAKTSISPERTKRMWLNMVVAGEDNLVSPSQWRAMARPGEKLKPNDEIVLGFDGGKSDDATALVAIRIRDMFIQPLGIWQKPDSYIDPEMKWNVDRRAVSNAVHDAFRTYMVRGMYADVNLWESYLADWQEAYGDTVSVKASPHKPFEWDMRGGQNQGGSKKVVEAHEALLTAIFDGKLRHAGDSTPISTLLASHVLNAKRRDSVHGVSFMKDSGSQSHKIDAYAALMLAYKCLTDYRLRGDTPDDNEGSEVWFL
jgi:phage terminase large subunit-like protein